MGSYDVSSPLVLLGLIFGTGYSLLGIGLVLAYRSSGFINFAHGATGLFTASMMSVVVRDYGVPYWLGFLGALVAAACIGAALEVVIVRKLSGSPKVLAMVATLGTGQALLLLALSFSGGGLGGGNFPQPPWFPDFDLDAYVSPSATALLVLSPIVVVGLYQFLQRSRFGLAIRGAASNPDAATLAGADPHYLAMLSWALAGAIAAFAAMLIIPNQSTVTPDTLGPDFIIRGLAVAALARFANLPVALAAGLGIGVAEQLIATNPDSSGYFEVLLFALILVGVARTFSSPREETEPWTTVSTADRLPDEYLDIWLIRHLGWVAAAVALVAAILIPIWASNESAFICSTVLAFAIIAMSISFLTGLGGQLSLGQVGFAAIGAVAAVEVSSRFGTLIGAMLVSAVVGAAVSAAVGLPALRVRGLLLAVATLAFALVTSSWLLRQDWAFGAGASTRPITLLGSELETSRGYYYVALGSFVVVATLATIVRQSSIGRHLIAVRDNDNAARVFQIASRRTLLGTYALAGAIAGVGGSVLAFNNTFVSRAIFTPSASVDVVAIAVVGGLGELMGPLLGAAYLIGIPEFFDLELSALAGLNAAWLILILEQPRGLVGLFSSTKRHVIDAIARLHGVTVTDDIEPVATPATSALSLQPASAPQADQSGQPLLEVITLTRNFGDLMAVDNVTFKVARGETLGLIGPNGAGKTTLFELVSGFIKPDVGRVIYDGADITSLSPEARSRLGLVRSFQNATLFPTMTPLQVAMMATQAATRRRLVLAGGAAERSMEKSATETLAAFGLGEIADEPISQLPTGTRRLVELAANVALQPRLLLLDEPSAGIAQAETEALGAAIMSIRDSFDITIVVIEHDMPLLTSICERMIALEVGAIIAEGTPHEIQRHEAVVRSYLGTDTDAIAKSGPVDLRE